MKKKIYLQNGPGAMLPYIWMPLGLLIIGLLMFGCNSNPADPTVESENLIALKKNLKVTEVNYHPLDEGQIDGNQYEFIELKNIGDLPLDLSDVAFTKGINYEFPAGTSLQPDAFVVLAYNSVEFEKRYKFSPFGEYSGKLKGSGEKIVVKEMAADESIISFKYSDTSPWPLEADGLGYTLESKESRPTGDPNEPSYWEKSSKIHGTPGAE